MKTEVPSYVSDSEQKRLTFSTRLALGASRFSNQEIDYLMQNEHHLEISELLGTLALLGHDQRIALKESVKTDGSLITIPSELAQREERLWKAEYGIKADFSGLLVPRQPLGYRARFCLMHEKVAASAEFFFQSDKKAYDGKVWRFSGDKSLDDCEMAHKHTGTFGFWVADEQEAPDGCLGKDTKTPINLHTVAVRELGWTTTTVPMRQLLGRVYFRQHGVHLDQTVVTFCADSGLPDADVPCVYFFRSGGTVRVGYGDVRYADGDVRFRRAVVPSNLKPSSLTA